jgi:Outer membrane protein beta-barrel domain
MKDKDFDDIFSKGLSSEQKQNYDERLWEKLAERLDEHENKGGALLSENSIASKSKLLPWVGLLLLLLLGANTWFLFKMNQSDDGKTQLLKEIKDLKDIIEKQNKQTKSENIIIRDTVIIYKYLPSTISGNSKNTFERSNFSQKVALSENSKPITNIKADFNTEIKENVPKSDFNPEKLIDKNYNQNQLNNNSSNSINGNTLEKATPLISNEKKSAFEITSPIQTINALPHWYMKQTLMVLPKQSSQNNIITPPQYNKRFWIGLNGGLINYHTSWFSKDNVAISRNEKSYQVGLKMEYSLNNNWRIMVGGDYCPFNFKIFWQDNRYNLPAQPDYFANNPNEYKLKYSQASQSLVQGYAGMKYVFSGTKWRPYLGIAYTQMEILPFETEYSFIKVSTNKEIIQTVKQNQISVSNIAMLNGGFEYKIGPRLTAQAEGFYYKDINKVKKTYDLFGLRGSLLIGF